MAKTVTLEDLSKAELLRFLRGQWIRYSEADLLFVQWQEACEEWKRLAAAAEPLRAPLVELAGAVDQAPRGPAKAKALAAYLKASGVSEAAEAKADRAWKRAEAINARFKAADTTKR